MPTIHPDLAMARLRHEFPNLAWRHIALEALGRNPDCGLPRAALEEPPRSYTGTLRVIHNDLEGEHILLDPVTADLVGVLDWTDVALGDPALDFAGLIYWRGPTFARQVANLYEGERDADLLPRARWHALCAGLHALELGRVASRPRWTAAGTQAIKYALCE